MVSPMEAVTMQIYNKVVVRPLVNVRGVRSRWKWKEKLVLSARVAVRLTCKEGGWEVKLQMTGHNPKGNARAMAETTLSSFTCSESTS